MLLNSSHTDQMIKRAAWIHWGECLFVVASVWGRSCRKQINREEGLVLQRLSLLLLFCSLACVQALWLPPADCITRDKKQNIPHKHAKTFDYIKKFCIVSHSFLSRIAAVSSFFLQTCVTINDNCTFTCTETYQSRFYDLHSAFSCLA